jgi:uncharacterized protein (DUF934 family)
VLGDFQNQARWTSLNFEGVQDWWEVVVELDVNDGTDDSDDLSGMRRKMAVKLKAEEDIFAISVDLLTLPLAAVAAAALAA